ncbi:MAG: AMP-binding protein [Acidimicrobiia bacterium]|nr:AMP-binding protein [Acidimicrobiia bacterium]
MSAGLPIELRDPAVRQNTLAAWSIHLGRAVNDPVALRRQLGDGDLASTAAATARRRPGAPALEVAGAGISHGRLDHEVGLAAASLRRLGLGPGQAVLVMMESVLAAVVAYLGAIRTGSAVVLAGSSHTQAEIRHMAAAADVDVIVGSGAGLETAIAAAHASVRDVAGLSSDDRHMTPLLLSDLAGEPHDPEPLDPDAPAILAFTSGTTGRPKCTPLTHRNLLASIRAAMWAWRWRPNEHVVHALPLSHQHGLSAIHATLLSGGRATVLERFDTRRLIDTIVEQRPTALFAVPAMHERLLHDLGDDVRHLGMLRFFTSGSAPLSISLAHRVERATGQLPLERYGSTEAGLNVSNPLNGPRIAGSIGVPLPGVEIALADGVETVWAPDRPGELLIRGPQVFAGYRDAASTDVFRSGWFRTGDIAVLDGRTGYLRIVGRSKEMIITGGMNVYPREVEDVLSSGRGVEDVAVVGVPSERWGEEVVAFVSPANVPTDSLADLAAQALAPYKRPKRIMALDAIPRTDLGKVIVSALIEAAAGHPDWMLPPGRI